MYFLTSLIKCTLWNSWKTGDAKDFLHVSRQMENMVGVGWESVLGRHHRVLLGYNTKEF